MKIKTAITTTAATLLLTAMGAQAEEARLVGASDSPAAAVCIAAVESDMAARKAARELGVFNFNMTGLVCNGMAVTEFVSQYREGGFAQQSAPMSSPEIVSFSANDQSPVTQLCIAAVTSPARFEEVRQQHFSRIRSTELEEMVRCNSKPLSIFVSEYRNQELTASL